VDRSGPALASDLFKRPAEFFGDERSVDVAHPWRWFLSTDGSWVARSAEDGFESRTAGRVPVLGLPCSGGSGGCGWLLGAASFGNTTCALLHGYGGPGLVRCSENQALLERSGADDEVDSSPRLGSFDRLALGNRFACAVRRDQRLECWGDLSGLRGDGKRQRSTWISGYWSALAVFTGDSYGCFVRADEQVLCFGTEPAMGLSRTGMLAQTEPRVLSIDSFGQRTPLRTAVLAAGPQHACALSGAGASCWGQNDQGQLGDGSGVDSPQPVQVQLRMDFSL